ncbi:hypothetical protein CDD83_7369 [Cordyceps sp. RAO-2017]|nr:hypothetical protein CDD83_7369 [Cordyceps sp. RAO-2017]
MRLSCASLVPLTFSVPSILWEGDNPSNATAFYEKCRHNGCSSIVLQAMPQGLTDHVLSQWNVTLDEFQQGIQWAAMTVQLGHIHSFLKWFKEESDKETLVCWTKSITAELEHFETYLGALSASIVHPDSEHLRRYYRFLSLPAGNLNTKTRSCFNRHTTDYGKLRYSMAQLTVGNKWAKGSYENLMEVRKEIDKWAGGHGRMIFHKMRDTYPCTNIGGCTAHMIPGYAYKPTNYVDAFQKIVMVLNYDRVLCFTYQNVVAKPVYYWID